MTANNICKTYFFILIENSVLTRMFSKHLILLSTHIRNKIVFSGIWTSSRLLISKDETRVNSRLTTTFSPKSSRGKIISLYKIKKKKTMMLVVLHSLSINLI